MRSRNNGSTTAVRDLVTPWATVLPLLPYFPRFGPPNAWAFLGLRMLPPAWTAASFRRMRTVALTPRLCGTVDAADLPAEPHSCRRPSYMPPGCLSSLPSRTRTHNPELETQFYSNNLPTGANHTASRTLRDSSELTDYRLPSSAMPSLSFRVFSGVVCQADCTRPPRQSVG